MYRHDAPHGAVGVAPDSPSRPPIANLTNQLTMNGSERMNLIHEALARARMREIWRGEHRHKRRAAREVIIAARRAERKRH